MCQFTLSILLQVPGPVRLSWLLVAVCCKVPEIVGFNFTVIIWLYWWTSELANTGKSTSLESPERKGKPKVLYLGVGRGVEAYVKPKVSGFVYCTRKKKRLQKKAGTSMLRCTALRAVLCSQNPQTLWMGFRLNWPICFFISTCWVVSCFKNPFCQTSPEIQCFIAIAA